MIHFSGEEERLKLKEPSVTDVKHDVSLPVSDREKGAPGESTHHPCPQSLAPPMVVRKLNPNETLRHSEIDVHNLVNGALSCYSLLNQPFPL